MSKNSYYFSHDYNSRVDAKIKSLLAKHGMAGYGVFWSIIEDLYNNANALRTDYESIAYDLRVDCEVVKSVIKDFGLFVFSGEFFSSDSVQRRLDERNGKSATARKSALSRWEKSERNADAMQTHSEGNAIKGKEIKEKENTVLPEQEFVHEKYSFDQFWNMYEKKVGRTKAEVAWKRLKPDQRVLAVEQMGNHKNGKERQFWKDPERYLRDRRWEDQPPVTQAPQRSAPRINLDDKY